GDSILGLGFAIAFYYGLTGFACAWYFRHALFKSVRNFVYAGLIPFAGGAMLTAIFVKSYIDLHPSDSGASRPIAGIGAPTVIDGQELDPEVQLLLRLLGRATASTHASVEEARTTRSREAKVFQGERFDVGRVEELTVPGPAGPLRARLYAPVGGDKEPPLL